MSHHNISSDQPHSAYESHGRHKQHGRRWILAGVAAAVVSALSFAGIGHANDGLIRGRHGMPGWHGEMDPETAGKRIDSMIGHLLADGTDEQRFQVSTIVKAAFNDLKPLKQQHDAARKRAVMLLIEPTIDRSALEQVRASELQLAEQVSKRITLALGDVAEVLTPEQRARLADRFKKRMGHAG